MTLAALITYLEGQIQTEIFDECATAENSAAGQLLFKQGLAKVIANGIKKYNDETFSDAIISPNGDVSSSTRVNPILS
jgi:hypothetical protein